jgi:hypothetical protein
MELRLRLGARLRSHHRDIGIRIASLLALAMLAVGCQSNTTGTPADAGSGDVAINAVFECGTASGVCRENQNYCVVHQGGAGGQGGPAEAPTTYTCQSFPANCARPDCACLQSSGNVGGCTCSEELAGQDFLHCLAI